MCLMSFLFFHFGTIQHRPETETCVSIIWAGNTWNYRSALDEAGVRGARYEVDDDEESQTKSANKYYRILKSLDVKEKGQMAFDIIKDVFHNLAMKVIVESKPIEDSDVADFINELKELPNLHFAK